MPSKVWQDEHRDAAFALIVDGNSALAAVLLLNTKYGTGYTRNALIGQVHRHGTDEVRNVMRARTGKNRTTLTNKKVKRVVRTKPPVRPESKLAAFLRANTKPLPAPEEVDVARVSFGDFERHRHCAWIPGDPADDFRTDKLLYCGLPPVPGLAYCHAHTRRAHSPPALNLRIVAKSPAKERVDA